MAAGPRGAYKDLPPPCRGRAGGECATADWTEERASRWAGDKPKTLPPISVNSIWAFLELNQVRWRRQLCRLAGRPSGPGRADATLARPRSVTTDRPGAGTPKECENR